jgi:hypothetical protein
MKSTILLQILSTVSVLACSSFSSLSHAAAAKETPLKVNTQVMTISGQVRGKAKISTLAVYMPASKFDKAKNPKLCIFPEDEYRMSGSDKVVKFAATQAGGKYSVAIPTAGVRGACEYVLDTIYFDVDSGPIAENIALKTKASVDFDNQLVADAGVQINETPQFADLKQIACEFDTKEQFGTCQTMQEDSFIQLQYEISGAPQAYTLDILDLKPQEY